MSRELSWTEAASKILEMEGQVWMGVPEMIKAIQKTGIKTIDSTYSQACRNLRSALKHHTRKPNGMFAQKQVDNMRVHYALTKHVRNMSECTVSSYVPTPPRLTTSNGDADMSSDTDVDSVGRADPDPPWRATEVYKPRRRKTELGSLQKRKETEQPRKRIVNQKRDLVDSSAEQQEAVGSILPPTSVTETLTVEVDPAQCRVQRTQRRSENMSPFCLPSPLCSLLGARRTLCMFNESVLPTPQRPMRTVRQKRSSILKSLEDDDSPPLLSPTPPHPAMTGVLCLDEQFSIPTPDTDVAFLKTDISGDPSLVQGNRNLSHQVEISGDVKCSDDSSDSEDDDDVSVTSEGGESLILLQPTPVSQLLRRRSLLARTNSTLHENTGERQLEEGQTQDNLNTMEAAEFVHPRFAHRSYSYTAGQVRPVRKAEVSRLLASLFSSNSPLIGENLKLLLNPDTFAGLTELQKKEVVRKLPAVDRQDNTQLAEGSLSNSFLSSTLREWQERLAAGLFTSEYRIRVRSEDKRRGSVKPEDAWKQQYYEKQYGDRLEEPVGSTFTPYYPASQLHALQSKCLDAIRLPWSKPTDKLSISTVMTPPRSLHQQDDEMLTATLPSPVTVRETGRNHAKTPHSKSPVLPKTATRTQNKSHAKPSKSAVRPHKPAAKELLKRLKGPPSQQNLAQALIRTFLTPIPPNHSFTTLVLSLNNNEDRPCPPASRQPLPPASPIDHPVFHDHFAFLSAPHVPEEFCEPVTSLPLHIPREHHTACIQRRTCQLEHNYAGSSRQPTLSVSLPRALLSSSDCVCSGLALSYCQFCHSLYHSNCSRTCPSCRA